MHVKKDVFVGSLKDHVKMSAKLRAMMMWMSLGFGKVSEKM